MNIPDGENVKHSKNKSDQLVSSIEHDVEEIIMQNSEDNKTRTELIELSDSLKAVINKVDSLNLDTSNDKIPTKLQDSNNEVTNKVINDGSPTNDLDDMTTNSMSTKVDEIIRRMESTTVDLGIATTTEFTSSEEIFVTEASTQSQDTDETTTEEVIEEALSEDYTDITTDDELDLERTTESSSEIIQSGQKGSAFDAVLTDLTTANLTKTDEKILLALLELEELKKQQNHKKEEINEKVIELETLLNLEEQQEDDDSDVSKNIATRVNKLLSSKKVKGQKARGGKTLNEGFLEEKRNTIKAKINLFENLQKQLSFLLSERHKFLQDISYKINQELGVIKQTVNFLQQLAEFKLDQGELLLGKMDPILNILQSGSTSVFLMISRFFKAVESVLAMKDQFLRSFSSDPADIQETRLLERIKDLKLKVILPAKMRFLLNVHANSDQLGEMVEEIFACVGELVDAKVDVIESVGEFVEQKIEYLSGLTGPGLSITTLLEAVRTGTLYKLANYGPVIQTGVPALSHQELEETVEELLSGADPSIPIIGPFKPLLVNHRVLGRLAGRYREDVINHYLARRLSLFIQQSKNKLVIRQGETILESWLPRIHLGTPCTSQVSLGRSWSRVVVDRRSRFSATTGPSVHSHSPPTLDMFGLARLHVNIHIQGHLNTKIGHQVWGKCLPKFSADSPFTIQGNAMGTAFAKVIVKNIRLETRYTVYNPILSNIFKGTQPGVQRPHLIFKFHIKLDGTVEKFNLSMLKLDGCEISVLGLKMFSHCNIVENIIRKQIHKATQNTFPLNDAKLLRELEYMIKMR